MGKGNRLSLFEAKTLAEGWEAQWKQECYDSAVDDHFRDASASQLVAMWENQTNEKGQPLSQFEFSVLCSAWLQTFGCLPPDDDAAVVDASQDTTPRVPEPADDTMLRMSEVARLTGLSESTIKRRVEDGSFPRPMHTSARRIGWPAREVKAWLRQLDDQRRASRQ
jgi:predicted DNA-binding transcriptional regulator AlpA